MKLHPLTPEEEDVIVRKGTEPAFTGEYTDTFIEGIYVCRRCRAPLYTSNSKFHSGCGWPSFDQEIPGAVKRSVGTDGRRIEITCATCGGHLGHVFEGEGFTPKNTRHCVNSLSLKFIPKEKKIVLGGGCFWCIEAIFTQLRGVTRVTSGYAGGNTANPTYQQVCSDTTGHAEVVQVEFDPSQIPLADVITIFFTTHDPTTVNQQGNDVGSQYRSIIFYTHPEQLPIIQKMIQRFTTERIYSTPIVTKVKPLETFYPAEDYHQNYYANNARQPYCQIVINPKLAKLKANYAKLLK